MRIKTIVYIKKKFKMKTRFFTIEELYKLTWKRIMRETSGERIGLGTSQKEEIYVANKHEKMPYIGSSTQGHTN